MGSIKTDNKCDDDYRIDGLFIHPSSHPAIHPSINLSVYSNHLIHYLLQTALKFHTFFIRCPVVHHPRQCDLRPEAPVQLHQDTLHHAHALHTVPAGSRGRG